MGQSKDEIPAVRRGELTLRFSDAVGTPLPPTALTQLNLTLSKHDFPFGTALSIESALSIDPAQRDWYLAKAGTLFNALVPENSFKWPDYEPCQGCVARANVDALLDFAADQRMSLVRGHTLEWFWAPFSGHWSRRDGCRAYETYVRQRVLRDVAAYRGRFQHYDVINELLHERAFAERCGMLAGGRDSLIVKLFRWAREADPDAMLCINEFNVLEGYRTDDYVELVRWLLDNGAPVDCIGVQSHVSPESIRSGVSANLDKMAALGLPLFITEVSVYSGWVSGASRQVNSLSERDQAQCLERLLTELFAHPSVHGILFWGFWDGNHWIRNAGFYRMDTSPKPSGRVLEDLLLRRWATTVFMDAPELDSDGAFAFEGVYGRYEYSARMGQELYRGSVEYPRSRGARQLRDVFLPVTLQ
jgi:GH35 family endo-1,4-beta-xylanase